MNRLCLCGCGESIDEYYSGSPKSYVRDRKYLPHHDSPRLGKYKPNPKRRAYHERANKIVDNSKCLIDNGDCLGVIQIAHIDQDYTNNNTENLKPLCRSHHMILDRRYKHGFRFNDLLTTKLIYTISSNKRRYKWNV